MPAEDAEESNLEETNEPPIADDRNYYKVEKWTREGTKVDCMVYAGSSLEKAREIFAAAISRRSGSAPRTAPADRRID
jgi:hypothetical protein